MRLWQTLLLPCIAALALTGCTPQTDAGTPAPSAVERTPPMAEVPVSATLGEPVALDRTMYGGSENGGCVLGPGETMVCVDRSGEGGGWLNSVIGRDQLRNPPSLEKHPPIPLPGFPLTRGLDRLDRVLATPQGYLLVVRNNGGTPGTKLTHIAPTGTELWAHVVSGAPLRDVAVTAEELLLSTETGVTSLVLADGKTGSTAAPAGTLLAGRTPGRDGFSTFTPGAVGLPKSAGGSILTLADVPAATASSCTGSTAPAADCARVEELHADADYLVVAKTDAAKRLTEVYDGAGTLLWTLDAPVTTAVRLGDTFALGYAGSNKAVDGQGRLAVVAAASGEEIGTTKALDGHSFYVAGTTGEGVIYGVDGEAVPGAYDISYAVMPITVETAKAAATAPTGTPTGSSTNGAADRSGDRAAGWKTEKSTFGAFTFQTPVGWTVKREPGVAGDNTTVTDPASGITISITEGLNGIGGMCEPGQAGLDESMTVLAEPVPGLHLASTPIGGRTPTLEVEQEGMHFSYSINMVGAEPECGMYAKLFEWSGVGTMHIGASVNAMDLAPTGMAPSDYLGSELHRDLSRVLFSITAAA